MVGDSLVRLFRFEDYDVEVHYYVNDMGRQIGLLVMVAEELEEVRQALEAGVLCLNLESEADRAGPGEAARALDRAGDLCLGQGERFVGVDRGRQSQDGPGPGEGIGGPFIRPGGYGAEGDVDDVDVTDSEDFATAATLMGASPKRVIARSRSRSSPKGKPSALLESTLAAM